MSKDIKDFIHKLIELKIKITLNNDQLKIQADQEVLTPVIISEIQERKQELIAFLSEIVYDNNTNENISPIPEAEYYELSHAQKRLWILDQFEEAKTAYNMGNAYWLEGNFELNALQFITSRWIERHEVFRTTFKKVNGQPMQFISNTFDGELPFEIIDLQTENAVDTANALIIDELNTRFDLEQGPLFKIRIYKIAQEKFVFLILMHHIVSDGWSLEVLMHEFIYYYNNYLEGNDSNVAPLLIQYKDYAHWSNSLLSGNRLSTLKTFWNNTFKDGVPKIDLPRDFNRPTIKTYNGKHIVKVFSEKTTREIKMLSEGKNGTLFMNLLSCVGILLYRYTGEKDMVIGTTTAGRALPELDNQIGFFVNTLALRLQFEGQQSYSEFSNSIKELCLNAFKHQEYPFDLLVDDLIHKRDVSRSPMFDVMVQLLNTSSINKKAEGLKGINVSQFRFDNPTSQFDLCFNFLEEQDSISLDLEFNTDLFSEDRMIRLITLLETIISEIVLNPLMALDALNYVPDYQLDELKAFNATDKSFEDYDSIIEMFEENVRLHPDNIAVYTVKDSVSYKELNFQADAFANFIWSLNLEDNSSIGIIHDKSISAIAAILGIFKSGHACVTIDPSLPDERIKFILNDCTIPVVISEKKYEDLNMKRQWECPDFNILINTDEGSQQDINYGESISDQCEMWDYLGENFDEEIELGGWISSFTGQPFTKQEMEEYSENALLKLRPYLTDKSRVLEIGCSSGLTLFKVAPFVKYYHGTDLSKKIINKTEESARAKKMQNTFFTVLGAHEISNLIDTYDIIIINSVIQSFSGYNYLLEVVEKALKLLNPGGIIFFGDIQDLDKKEALIKDLEKFNVENENQDYLVKSDWSKELFISKLFFSDLKALFPQITNIAITDKIGEISNELRDFRFDCIVFTNEKEESLKEVSNIKFRKRRYNQIDFENISIKQRTKQSLSQKLAYTIYTSGTTGRAKGVMVSHSNLVNISLSWRNRYELETIDVRLAQIANMSFDVFFGDLCRGLLNGGTLYLCDKELVLDVAKFYDYINEHKISILESTVGVLLPLMKYIHEEGLEYSFLKLIILGSDVCLMKDFQWLKNEFGNDVRIINSYGTTETTIDSSYYEIVDPAINFEGYTPIGKPMDNIKYFILDKNKRIVPIGVRGDLHISGTGVSLGYRNCPELTKERFFELYVEKQSHKVYNTGDLGYWLPDGNVQFLGRDDGQIKIRGYRVEIEEVENLLAKHQLIEQIAVVVKKDKEGHNYLVAFIVAKNERLNVASVKEYAKKHLSDYLIPSVIMIVEKLVYTNNGKIDRKALLEFKQTKEKKDELREPLKPFEDKLVAIWKELLDMDCIEITDNFFEIGGHSLKAVQMVSRIQKNMGIRLEIKDVFIHQTIEELATRVEAVEWVKIDKNTDSTNNERILI
ncbi:condensation domain-containing protein [Flavobacterium sp. WG21]|uniref:condensation domain-containing protein n=1 Tax=Flavobacterium sp. WG21 TaxID=1229487 RepID=UPI00034DDE92|nr:condensation domain-containing protein [Flavobacterium sp. WG21]